MLPYIDDCIAKYVCTSPEGSMICELCLQRDNNDFILSTSELSMLIDDLYVLIKLISILLLKTKIFIYKPLLLYLFIFVIAFPYSLMICVLYGACKICIYLNRIKIIVIKLSSPNLSLNTANTGHLVVSSVYHLNTVKGFGGGGGEGGEGHL